MSLFCYLDRGTMEAPGPEQHEGWSRTAVWSRDRAAASSVSRTSVSAYVAKGQKEAAERAGAALKQLQQRRRQQKRAAQVPQTPEVTAEEREDGVFCSFYGDGSSSIRGSIGRNAALGRKTGV